jgi:hypothetical protein
MFCRKKEFGKSFAMYWYSNIMNDVSICENLVGLGVKIGSTTDKTIGGYLANMRGNCYESICVLFNDKSNKKYINQLKEWNLLDNLNYAVKRFNDLWKKENE